MFAVSSRRFCKAAMTIGFLPSVTEAGCSSSSSELDSKSAPSGAPRKANLEGARCRRSSASLVECDTCKCCMCGMLRCALANSAADSGALPASMWSGWNSCESSPGPRGFRCVSDGTRAKAEGCLCWDGRDDVLSDSVEYSEPQPEDESSSSHSSSSSSSPLFPLVAKVWSMTFILPLSAAERELLDEARGAGFGLFVVGMAGERPPSSE